MVEGPYTCSSRCRAARWDEGLAPRRRFYGEDPFGNRVEFIEP